MKKLITSLTLCGVALMATPISVRAADDTGVLGQGYTDAEIKFLAPDINTIRPVNPDSPNEEAAPDVLEGSLTQKSEAGVGFVYVTDNLSFGDGKAKLSLGQHGQYTGSILRKNTKGNGGDTTANGITENTPFDWQKNFVVEVADTRSESAGDWTVNVAGNRLDAHGKDGQVTYHIDGAGIKWPTAHSNTQLTNSGNGKNGAVLAKQDVNLELGGQSASNMLFQASKGNGAGVTALRFDPKDIILTVPANKAQPETYSTTLTWTLETTPFE